MEEDLENLIRETHDEVIKIRQEARDNKRRITNLECETTEMKDSINWNENRIYIGVGIAMSISGLVGIAQMTGLIQ